ncbi:MAG: hypothetical protein M1831_003297 [Alyxoria varia]|nr:MAG: hypothetical protein M1831_003297 [Alyxoria varia]
MSRQHYIGEGGSPSYPPEIRVNGSFLLQSALDENTTGMVRETHAKTKEILRIVNSIAAKVQFTKAEQTSSVATTHAWLRATDNIIRTLQTANLAREQHASTNNTLKHQHEATRTTLSTLQPAHVSRDQYQSVMELVNTLPTTAVINSLFEHTNANTSSEITELKESFSDLRKRITNWNATQPKDVPACAEGPQSSDQTKEQQLRELIEYKDQRIAELLEIMDSQRERIEYRDKRIQEILGGTDSQRQQDTSSEQSGPGSIAQAHENRTLWNPQGDNKRRRISSTPEREDEDLGKSASKSTENTLQDGPSKCFKFGEPSVWTAAKSQPFAVTNSEGSTFGSYRSDMLSPLAFSIVSPSANIPLLIAAVEGLTKDLSILPRDVKSLAEQTFAAAAPKAHGVTIGEDNGGSFTRCLCMLMIHFNALVDRPGESCETCIGAQRPCLQITSGEKVAKCVPLPADQRKNFSPGDRGYWIHED